MLRESPVAGRLVRIGFVSVGFFYSLSGFVLALAYANRKRDDLKFYISRLARIYPLYALALLLALPGFLLKWNHGSVKSAEGWAALVTAPFLLQAWIPSTALAWNGPGWSLSCETLFYLIFPFVLPWALQLSLRNLWFCLAGSWVAAMLPPIMVHFFMGWQPVSVHIPDHWRFWADLVSYNPIARAPEFLAGILAGCILLRREKFDSRLGTWLIAAGVAIGGVAMLAVSHIPVLLLHNGVLLPVWLFVIAGFTMQGFPGRLFSFRPFVFLGEISYGIYILQSPVSGYFSILLRPWLNHREFIDQYDSFGLLLLYVAVLTAVAALTFVYYEKPVGRFINRAWKRRELTTSS